MEIILSSQSENLKSTVFIGGSPRSGTTWLHYLVGSHPRVATHRETHLFDRYVMELYKWYDSEKKYSAEEGLGRLFERENFECELIKPFVESVLLRLSEQKRMSTVVLEKTPGNLLMAHKIRGILPHARLLVIIRDPRSVVASFKAAATEAWGAWSRKPIEEICFSWVRYGLAFDEASGEWGEGQIRKVHYEDLRRQPAKELAGVFDWLGLDHDSKVLSDILEMNTIDRLKNLPETDWRHESRFNFFRAGGLDSWKLELGDDEINTIRKICGIYMERWGYE